MLIRTVRMTFAPERLEAFLALFAATRDRIASAPGCRHLELWRDVRFPNVLTTFSHWDSPEALDAYRHSDLFRETWAQTTPLFAAAPVALSHYGDGERWTGETPAERTDARPPHSERLGRDGTQNARNSQ